MLDISDMSDEGMLRSEDRVEGAALEDDVIKAA